MPKMTATEMETAFAIMRKCRDRENYGMTAPNVDYCSMRDRMDFYEQRWNVDWDGAVITKDGIPCYKIIKRYSARKSDGMYKCLKPKVEYIG
jgi:hypothetical protein